MADGLNVATGAETHQAEDCGRFIRGRNRKLSTLDSAIKAPAVWKGPEIDYRREGFHVFSTDELEEIDRAIKHQTDLGKLDIPDITPESFPLDKVGELMRSLCDRLRFGRGFVLLRGIPREKYSADEMAGIYVGLSSYIGRPLTQSYLGDLLGHVIDVDDVEPKSRDYRKGGPSPMHNDSADDVVGLMCVRAAISGGDSRISSALAVYNGILADRPELAATLRTGYYYARSAEDARHATGALSREPVPTFATQQGEVSCNFAGSYARNAEELGHPMSPLQREALTEIRRLAASDEYYLDMNFAEGDIQFLNNRLILHGRTDYEDAKEMVRRRHLMRIWLRVPNWPRQPENQIFQKDEDRALWARNREPYMEFPSVHFRGLEGRTPVGLRGEVDERPVGP